MFFGMPPDYDPGVVPAMPRRCKDECDVARRRQGLAGSKAFLFAAHKRRASNVLMAGTSPAVQVPIDGSNSPTNS